MILIFVFVFCAICTCVAEGMNKQQRDTLFIFCLFILACVSGFRNMGGNDFLVYENIYSYIPTMPDVFNTSKDDFNYEYGYVLWVSLFKTLGFSYYGYILINSFIFYVCLWYGLKRYTSNFGVLILIFLYKLFFYNTFISMRQSVTVAGFFLIAQYIEQRKLIPYFIGCYVLSRFHNGAYLLFLLYGLAYVNLTKRKIIFLNLLFIPTIFIGFAGIDVLGPIGKFLESQADTTAELHRVDKYFNNENLSPIGIFHTLEYFLLMYFFVINYDKISKLNCFSSLAAKLFICLLPLFTLFRGSEILTREKDYFTIFYAVILCYLMQIDKGKWRYFVLVSTMLLCAFGYYRYIVLFDGGVFLNYKPWFMNPDLHIFTSTSRCFY